MDFFFLLWGVSLNLSFPKLLFYKSTDSFQTTFAGFLIIRISLDLTRNLELFSKGNINCLGFDLFLRLKFFRILCLHFKFYFFFRKFSPWKYLSSLWLLFPKCNGVLALTKWNGSLNVSENSPMRHKSNSLQCLCFLILLHAWDHAHVANVRIIICFS